MGRKTVVEHRIRIGWAADNEAWHPCYTAATADFMDNPASLEGTQEYTMNQIAHTQTTGTVASATQWRQRYAS